MNNFLFVYLNYPSPNSNFAPHYVSYSLLAVTYFYYLSRKQRDFETECLRWYLRLGFIWVSSIPGRIQ